MVHSTYCKQRILYHSSKGLKVPFIAGILKDEENIVVTRMGVHNFIKRFNKRRCLMRAPGSGHPLKVNQEITRLVKQQMRLDNETTANQLHAMLVSKGFDLSIKTIFQCRASLGWTFRGSAYYQLIRTANMEETGMGIK